MPKDFECDICGEYTEFRCPGCGYYVHNNGKCLIEHCRSELEDWK